MDLYPWQTEGELKFIKISLIKTRLLKKLSLKNYASFCKPDTNINGADTKVQMTMDPATSSDKTLYLSE